MTVEALDVPIDSTWPDTGQSSRLDLSTRGSGDGFEIRHAEGNYLAGGDKAAPVIKNTYSYVPFMVQVNRNV